MNISPFDQQWAPPFWFLEYEQRHAFGGGVHVKIVRNRDATFEVTELPAPGIHASAVNPPRPVSDENIQALADALAAIRIPLVPPYAFGLDGWISKLRISTGCNELVVTWWCEPVDDWIALDVAVREICQTTGCYPRKMSPEDRMRQAEEVEKAEARATAGMLARQDDFKRRLEATRAKAISLGLATRENVNQVLCEMTREGFARHFSEFRVSRVHFKD